MEDVNTFLVTGGAGFIGSTFVLSERKRSDTRILNLDLLTYAANPRNLESLREDPFHTLIRGDIGDRTLVRRILEEYRPTAVVNFAAESHVDRSIDAPDDFIMTNVVSTFRLLEEVRRYWEGLQGEHRETFRFLHVSTDEVYGSLDPNASPFNEMTRYAPNSPYSASKAASDHLVRAYHHTYGLPTLTTNCSNNYGPRQFPEKLIPLMILNAIGGKPLPVYGDGMNVRDWLYVEDHCDAIQMVLVKGRVGEVYNIGGHCEKTNLEIVKTLCGLLDDLLPNSHHAPHSGLITFVKDRPGHDRRYAVDCSKISRELGWQPRETLETGLRRTVLWYLENEDWIKSIQTGSYRDWLSRQYGAMEGF